MSALVIAHVHSVDFGPEIVEYLRRIDATIEAFDGRFLVHGGPVESVEGAWNGDTIVIEFPSREAAHAWYESPAYLEIRSLRTDNMVADVIFADTLPVGYRAESSLEYLLAGS